MEISYEKKILTQVIFWRDIDAWEKFSWTEISCEKKAFF